MTRWVVRPKGILTTPKLLRDVFQARRTAIIRPHRLYSWEKDIFLAYPPPHQIKEIRDAGNETGNARLVYRTVQAFAHANKPRQRAILHGYGLRVPATGTRQDVEGHRLLQASEDTPAKYITRPLRHSQGRGYRITTDPTDWSPATEYIQRLFPKVYEYRVIYFKGHKISTLLKKVPENIDPDGPWNHAKGASFVSVNNPDNDRLRHTTVYEDLSVCPIIKYAHLVGVDILLGPRLDSQSHRRDYVISEFNFAPSISIEATIERLKHHP
jgi:hypothetical protein